MSPPPVPTSDLSTDQPPYRPRASRPVDTCPMSTTPPTLIKVRTSAEVLAVAPYMLGYQPQQSVVFVLFDGKRTCGALRLDLPTDTSPVTFKRFANFALGTVAKVRGVAAIAPMIFTEATFGDDSRIPHTELMDVLRRRIRHMGFEVRDALCLAGDGWASYLAPSIPKGGQALEELHEAMAAFLPQLPDAPLDRDQSAGSVRVPLDPVKGASTLLRIAGLQEVIDDLSDEQVASSFLARDATPLFVEWVLSWGDEDIEQRAWLALFRFQNPPMRDQAMLQWAFGMEFGERLFAATENAGADFRKLAPELGDRMLGIGPRPDLARVNRGIDLLRRFLDAATDDLRPAPLCMLAWLSWAIGRSTHAAEYIEQALAIDPDYGMATLLASILDAGLLPEWAFEK